jgi:hypothetical protein
VAVGYEADDKVNAFRPTRASVDDLLIPPKPPA